MKYLISFSLMLLLSVVGCKKNKINGEQLPPETQEGKFTIGFKVDGKIYTAKGKGGLLSSDFMYYSFPPYDSTIYLGAGTIDESKRKFDLELTFKFSGNLGIFYIFTFPFEGVFFDKSNGTLPTGNNTYKTTINHKGSVNLTYFDGQISPHFIGTILAGTFEMEAVNSEGKLIKITDGRFDIGK